MAADPTTENPSSQPTDPYQPTRDPYQPQKDKFHPEHEKFEHRNPYTSEPQRERLRRWQRDE